MKNSLSSIITFSRFILLLGLSATSSGLLAQVDPFDSLAVEDNGMATDIRVFGTLYDYHSKQPITSAEITIVNEKNEIRLTPANAKGGWINLIPCDHLYKVTFTAPGYATKMLVIDARSIPIEDQLGGFSMDIDIVLFKAIDGVDYEILEKPIGISRYDSYSNSMAWDDNQAARLQKGMKDMMKKYDKAFKEAEKRKN